MIAKHAGISNKGNMYKNILYLLLNSNYHRHSTFIKHVLLKFHALTFDIILLRVKIVKNVNCNKSQINQKCP